MDKEQPAFDTTGQAAAELPVALHFTDDLAEHARIEVWPVVGGVAAGKVLERDSTTGDPNVWEAVGGSLYGLDSKGKPIKLRDKWG